jgi:hypothetical protein
LGLGGGWALHSSVWPGLSPALLFPEIRGSPRVHVPGGAL